MPPKNLKKGPRRVTCCCRTNKCYLGRYTDAYGVIQAGVEVVPSTLQAHMLADAQLAHSESLSPDSLVSPLSRLGFNSTASPENETRAQLAAQNSIQIAQRTIIEEDASDENQQAKEVALNKVCSAAISARNSGLKEYQCEQFYTNTFNTANPMLLYIALIAAMLKIFGSLSISTASWLLDCLRITLELCLTCGLNPLRKSASLLASDATTLNQIPKTIGTVIKWLNIEPHLIEMNCCEGCFALYPLTRTPARCTHRIRAIPGGPPDTRDPNEEVVPSAPDYEPDISEFAEKTCGQRLLKSQKGRDIPVRKYAIQSLSHWIAALLSRPEVEEWLDESLEESRKPFSPSDIISDIHQSKAWKEFKGPDGDQFTAKSGHLTFAMFMDAINPFGNKQSGRHASITFIVLVCLTFPIKVRYLPEHIFIVGIAPGPREPSLEQTNWILRPNVTELQTLWNPGLLLSRTHQYGSGRLVRVGLLLYIADVVATRRSLGFPSATATYFCSICHLKKKDVNILDPKMWPLRTCAQHRIFAHQARDAQTPEERQKIFRAHGVRYSALVDLEYWNIIEYHVIDAMHNLLLGLIAWHIRRFWAMKEELNEEHKLPPITKVELLNLFVEHSEPVELDSDVEEAEKDIDGDNIEGASFSSTTSDEDFDPLAEAGWNGRWEAPPLDDIIMDATMLKKINVIIPRIHIPTWIKRAIPVLGKASFGKLKADEWRNLCTLQLPLILIPLWSGKDQASTSLLKNFCHLVSLVKLALKRSMKSDYITRYEHHIRQYLEGSLLLFTHCHLAPNHHLAIHLADCLRRFGPVRAWWSFPFERLMAQILKGCHNNQLGKLEITVLKNYSRAGNLSALLKDKRLPTALKPFLPRMQSLFEQTESAPKELDNSNSQPLESTTLEMLVKFLNVQDHGKKQWMTPEEWSKLPAHQQQNVSPVPARAFFHRRVIHNEVSYSTFTANTDDSLIAFSSVRNGEISFGRIFAIFTHHRTPNKKDHISDTWLHIQCFPQIPSAMRKYDPFENIDEPDVQAYLRAWGPVENQIIKTEHILGHCTWLMYKPGEIHQKLTVSTVGLLYMDR